MRHLFGSSDAADSAGQPWEGRVFEPNAFAGDDGTMPESFADSLRDWAEADPATPARAEAFTRLINTLPTTRFLIPLVAETGDEGTTEAGLRVDKTQELSVVNVAGPGGEKVLPVFSNVAALTQWRQDARPVPVDGVRCALAAVQDECQWIVIDPGQSASFVVRGPALRSMALGEQWVSPLCDERVLAVFTKSADASDEVQKIELEDGDPFSRGADKEITVRVTLAPGLNQDEVMNLMSRLSAAWSEASEVARGIESMQILVVPESA